MSADIFILKWIECAVKNKDFAVGFRTRSFSKGVVKSRQARRDHQKFRAGIGKSELPIGFRMDIIHSRNLSVFELLNIRQDVTHSF